MAAPFRVNVGCGPTPTPGWVNLDNSITVRLARIPRLMEVLGGLGIVGEDKLEFARVVRRNGVQWASATQRIPLPSNSSDVVYSSHMLEHLDPCEEVPKFLAEVQRVLIPGGTLRIVVPDLRLLSRRYIEESYDADQFVEALFMASRIPRGLLSVISHLMTGFRNHLWMYDSSSLIQLLARNGFENPVELRPGETTIPNPGSLDLHEQERESCYVEAVKRC